MFFLGGSHEARKLAWIKWKNVLSSYDNGGLNIGSLKSFNLTLLQKWRWRLLSHKNTLWIKVIKALHGHEGGFDNNGCIYNSCGMRIRFWKDTKGRRFSFYIRYNRLYRLEKINEVEDTCVWSLGTDGTFSVKDARCIIDSNIFPSLAPSAISCPSCNGNVESLNHIFFECNIAKDIWMLVRKWCDTSFPPFTSYELWKGWFTSWQVVKRKS
ncbi:RNA-directed DNA polymerase, eukaryota, reverse transcriptase zinc-binding domain protein [Tanacetum coccineum]